MKVLTTKNPLCTTLCFFLLFQLNINAQVFPYGYSPNMNNPSEKKFGLVDAKYNKVTEPIYDEIAPFENQHYNQYTIYFKREILSDGDTKKMNIIKGILNNKGDVVQGIESANLEYDGNGRIAFEQVDKKHIFYNLDEGKKIFEAGNVILEKIERGEMYFILLKDRSTSVVHIYNDLGGKLPTPEKPDLIVEFVESVSGDRVIKVRPRSTYVWTYFDTAGNEIQAEDFEEEEEMPVFLDMAVDEPNRSTKQDREGIKRGIIDMLTGKYPEYKVGKFYEDKFGQIKLIEIKKDYQIGLVNKRGEIVLPCEYRSIQELYTDFDNDFGVDKAYLQIKKSTHTGIINLHGKMVIPPIFSYVEYRRSSPYFHIVSHNGYWGLAFQNGNYFLPKECECYEE